jgi:hypothetical protein
MLAKAFAKSMGNRARRHDSPTAGCLMDRDIERVIFVQVYVHVMLWR